MEPRCPACPKTHLPIPGGGPSPCDMLVVGERPSKMCNIKGRVAAGPVGEEFDRTYLPLANLSRSDVRFENVVRCHDPSGKAPSPDLVQSCSAHFLPRVLDRAQPSVVLLLGASACRVSDRPIRLDTSHGLPQYGSILGGRWTGWLVPMHHPASGLHDTRNMTHLLADFQRLGDWLAGEWEAPTPRTGQPDYQLCESEDDLMQYLLIDSELIFGKCQHLTAIDTESHGKDPWSIQMSLKAGTGRMVQWKNRELIRKFGLWLHKFVEFGGTLVYHFAGHDMDELAAMGVPDNLPFRDTMQEAFHQGDLPQGLKPLAHRLLGANMRSWEDVVKPASLLALQEWLESALSLAMVNLTEKRRKKTKSVRYEDRPSAVEAICQHVLTHMAKDDEYDPWDAIERFWLGGLRSRRPDDWQMEYLVEEIGPMPILGIGNCRLDDAVQYGCGDADWTLQVADALAARRQDKRYQIFEGDRDQ